MKIFLVGGAVRNEILGIPAKDFDYVVTGSTNEEMISLGYKLVGQDFPVFLHPETGEEYALARRERSTGKGYHDFEVDFNPDVMIEDDLLRRDITINSIAKDIETGEYIDPFGGIQDIENRIFRITHKNAFVEDPVRILRLARFLSQFPAFAVDKETIAEARIGDIKNATAERVNAEFIKAINGLKPSRFFDFLKEIDQLEFWFPEVYALVDQTQPFKHHAEKDAYEHTMMVLDSSARHHESQEVRFGCLVHDFGKGLTPKHLLPKHHGHEQAGVKPVNDFCDRLKISNDLRRVGTRSAKYHGHVHKAFELNPKTFVKVYDDIKNHATEDAFYISRVAFHDNEGRLTFYPYENNLSSCNEFLDNIIKLSKVKLSDFYSIDDINSMTIDRRKQLHHKIKINSLF